MRKLIGLVVILLVAASGYAADLRYIRFGDLENLGEYEESVAFVYNNQRYLQNYIPDEFWNAPLPKAQYAERLSRLYDQLNEFPEQSNQEYLILRAMISEFMYNLDVPDTFALTVNHYMEVEELPGRDYRNRWMLGRFYAGAARPVEAIEQFKFIADLVPAAQLYQDFWGDYGYAAALAYMRSTAVELFDIYFEMSGVSPDDHGFYRGLTDTFTNPPLDKDIDRDRLFTLFERESGLGMLSRPLGLWLPLRDDWGLWYTGLEDGNAAVVITPGPLQTSEGRTVSYTIGVFSYFDRVQAESLLSGFEEVRRISSEDYVDTYEYSDATYYEELDGAKGNIVIIRSPVPERPSISIEAPAKRPRGPQSSGGLSYEPLGEEYRRLGAEITHVVLLDVGASVHDQAHEVFLEFLAGMGYE